MDGDVILLGSAGQGEGMVLPHGNFGTAQEDKLHIEDGSASVHPRIDGHRWQESYLASACLDVLLLDLDFDHLARMLDDLGDEGRLSATNLPHEPLDQIDDGSIGPELPEAVTFVAERWRIGLDHAKGTVHGPENEETDEQMMCGPEAVEVLMSRLVRRCQYHCDQDR